MTATTSTTDRIEKHFEVKAKRSRVWRALSDAEEFGTWFGLKAEHPFVAGKPVRAAITFKGYEHVTFEMVIGKIVPESYFSYSWHPYAMDTARDYSKEPMTLVEFKLQETATGTAVTIIESGFDALPADRRAEAFRMNEGGWASQSKKLAAYVE